mmetsp:Transcript_100121/g.172842  ORF Transcript_100121/g.172842 Transcript_100121/m.172842 type:complete len:107 (-) Transcript_100121:705-1025(-)
MKAVLTGGDLMGAVLATGSLTVAVFTRGILRGAVLIMRAWMSPLSGFGCLSIHATSLPPQLPPKSSEASATSPSGIHSTNRRQSTPITQQSGSKIPHTVTGHAWLS